jgi:hypothetical protein
MSKATKTNAVNFEYVDFEKLVFLENNPRTRTDEGKMKMAEDIKADPSFYENRPTLVNLKNGVFHVYAGDLRAHAAHEVLGWAKVPCNIEKDVPDEIMRRRAILDNTHRETWDSDKLSEWEFEREELEEMGVVWQSDENEPQTYHSANEMTENDVNILEEFDPIGLSADIQKIVFIFDNKTKAEEWLSDKPELQVKKSRMQWEVNLSTLYI